MDLAAFHALGSAEFAGDVGGDASGFVFEEPFGEVVNAVEVIAVADAASVAGAFDFGEEILWAVLFPAPADHSGEAEADFKKGPAIEAFEID